MDIKISSVCPPTLVPCEGWRIRPPVTHGSPWVTDWRGESVTQALTWKWTLCLFPRSQRWLLCSWASPYNVLSAGFACRPYVNDGDEAGLEHLWDLGGCDWKQPREHLFLVCTSCCRAHLLILVFSLSGVPVFFLVGPLWADDTELDGPDMVTATSSVYFLFSRHNSFDCHIPLTLLLHLPNPLLFAD